MKKIVKQEQTEPAGPGEPQGRSGIYPKCSGRTLEGFQQESARITLAAVKSVAWS